MIFSYGKSMSRLKKKLLLYFILISVVSISVSAEIILELGSPTFRDRFKRDLTREISRNLSEEEMKQLKENLDESAIFASVTDLQVRMVLLLLVVSLSIIGSFFLFTKDIVTPMEGMVSATKKIAEGDLSASVPVLSEDEIGQIGNLINEMSVNLQDLILQIKSEVERLQARINVVSEKVTVSLQSTDLRSALDNKKMQVRDIRKLIATGDDMNGMLNDMLIDLSALQAFVNLYKVFEVSEVEPGQAPRSGQE